MANEILGELHATISSINRDMEEKKGIKWLANIYNRSDVKNPDQFAAAVAAEIKEISDATKRVQAAQKNAPNGELQASPITKIDFDLQIKALSEAAKELFENAKDREDVGKRSVKDSPVLFRILDFVKSLFGDSVVQKTIEHNLKSTDLEQKFVDKITKERDKQEQNKGPSLS